ncbi:MAG: glycosyltransferase family 39 protein [Candidatus Hermodarchaeota archaeon]
MAVSTENMNETQPNKLESIKKIFFTYWSVLLIGFIFSITRIRYLTYPLGLMHRQPVKEGYRSYEAVTASESFGIPIFQNIYLEQPIYVFILEIGYHLLGNSPDGLVLWGRCIGFILSAITLIILYKISELIFEDITAKFAALLYALSPYGISLGIAIQRETLMWLFGLCAIYWIIKYIKTNEEKYIIFNLIFSVLSVLTKLTGFYFLFTSIVSLILFYSGSFKGIKISLHIRIILITLLLVMIGLFSAIFSIFIVERNSFSAFRHTIIYEPTALIDTQFWGNVVVNAMLYIPITTVLLAGVGLFFVVASLKKENLVLLIWIIFTGMEIVFYGYGAIIHEYYVLYLLHPLVILAGNTLFLLYQSNLKQVIENGHVPMLFVRPFLIIFLFLSSGFIPWFYYTGEDKMIRSNKPFYEDIRSIGTFLKEYDIDGKDIVVVYLKENYTWWKFQLTLVRTYTAKSGIMDYYTSNISEVICSGDYNAVIGWSDDLDTVKPELAIHFQNYIIYQQDILFRGNFEIPSIELWFNPF